jgi:deoxyribodipyrimidine photo-lyase
LKSIPADRLRVVLDAPTEPTGRHVLYWMTSARRTGWNFGLQRAVDWSRELKKPLIVLEGLRCGYRWASDRIHRFVMDGMADNARRFERTRIGYFPYVEPTPGAGKGLLAALGKRACVVVTDEFPEFELPRMLAAAGRQLDIRFEAVDSNGLLPLATTDREFPTAHAFRRFLQKNLPPHLERFPKASPLAGARLAPARIPSEVIRRWPPAFGRLPAGAPEAISALPIDHAVAPIDTRGGRTRARSRLRRFVDSRLDSYLEHRNSPESEVTSGLSPYLHFGQIGSHEIAAALLEREGWHPGRIGSDSSGSRTGWWGVSEAAEAFLDQLVTWRELGFNMSWHREDHDRFESLPPWALETLAVHESDPRQHVYTPEEFDRAATHDPLWNAAQIELVREGRVHNYMRMLWGKKILEWSPTPRHALHTMVELNNKYALDGRDPNSYSGIFWILGRYDRAWGPERPIFGKVRYMSSENTARKFPVAGYLKRFAP